MNKQQVKQLIREELDLILERKTGGDCFQANGREFLEMAVKDSTMKLVHGEVTGQGKIEGIKHWHCWIEVNDRIVLDFSEKRKITMNKNQYYEIGNIDERRVKKYDYDTFTKNILKYKHWGPWD